MSYTEGLMAKKMTAKTDTELYIKGHYKWYIAGFVLALAVFAWATLVAHHRTMTGWEVQLFRSVNNWPENRQHIFVVISLLGGSVWTPVGVVIVTFIMKMYRLCWRLAASVIAAYAFAFLAKHAVGRARPQELLQHIHVRATESGMGFPSGHATIAAVVSLTLLPYLPKKWRWIPPLWIVLVMLSRLYLGVHAPLDVLGGVCVGVIVVSFIRIMPQPLRVFLRLD
jgi:membrane-associated phospholipid phosphatase